MTIKYPNVAFPPPNMKSLIDRTAEMIVRNEPILSLSAHKSRLSFLNEQDKYFQYFIMKMEQLENELYLTDEDDMDSDLDDIDDFEKDSDEEMFSDNDDDDDDDDDDSDCDDCDCDDSDDSVDNDDDDDFDVHHDTDDGREMEDDEESSEIAIEL